MKELELGRSVLIETSYDFTYRLDDNIDRFLSRKTMWFIMKSPGYRGRSEIGGGIKIALLHSFRLVMKR